MSGPSASLLGDGSRLHLHHGPIDLIVAAEGDHPRCREIAFKSATKRFGNILGELVDELDLLRRPVGETATRPLGEVAIRMDRAARAHSTGTFVTPMAAVAGAVADEILSVMVSTTYLRRAFVNNGGDIAIHLDLGQSYRMAIQDLNAKELGAYSDWSGLTD